MTSKERVLAALNHEEADRVPIWTLIDNAAVLRHFAPEDFDFSQLSGEDAGDAVLELTHHACRGLGIDVTFVCDTWPVNPFPRETAKTVTSADTSYVASLADLKNHTPEIDSYDDIARVFVPSLRSAQEIVGPQTLLVSQGSSAIEGIRALLGLELCCLAIYDAPRDMARIMDAYTELQRTKAQVYADHIDAPAYQVSCDIGFKTGTFFSPDFLRREAFPRLKRELEPIKQAGMKVIFHSDGNLMEVLDDLVDVGIDALNPVETTAGMDLGAIKKRYGKNLAFVGNVDANIATNGTPDDVVAEVRRCIRQAAKGGGLLIDSGAGEIFPDFPVENVIAMCDAVRRFGRYPIAE